MSKLRSRAFKLTIAVSAVALVGIPAAPAAADEPNTVPGVDTSFLGARLSAPLDFESALAVAQSSKGLNVVGLRFENDQIVGEYYLGSDKSPSEFLQQFADMYGTLPQVAGLVVEVPKRTTTDEGRYAPIPTIETERPAFVAPPIPQDKMDELFALPYEGDASRDSLGTLSFPDWEPLNVYPATFRVGSSQWFLNAIDWGGVTDPNDIPGSFGLEVGIDLYNGAVGTRGSIIPGDICGPNFRDQFIAKNYNWNSWSVSSPNGGLAASYPYADLNDFLDSCGRNAMTIGFASPQDMPTFTPGPDANLNTFIDAKIGVTTSSGLGGGLQLVNSASCPFDGSIAFTDCMGIPTTAPTGVAASRLTLSTSRGWVAATSKCWASGSYGTATPVVMSC